MVFSCIHLLSSHTLVFFMLLVADLAMLKVKTPKTAKAKRETEHRAPKLVSFPCFLWRYFVLFSNILGKKLLQRLLFVFFPRNNETWNAFCRLRIRRRRWYFKVQKPARCWMLYWLKFIISRRIVPSDILERMTTSDPLKVGAKPL